MLAINESKLDGTISDIEVYIRGYIIIRKDRSRSGGGVALYIIRNKVYNTAGGSYVFTLLFTTWTWLARSLHL